MRNDGSNTYQLIGPMYADGNVILAYFPVFTPAFGQQVIYDIQLVNDSGTYMAFVQASQVQY